MSLILVIQRSGATKDLGYIHMCVLFYVLEIFHFVQQHVFATLRYALNDN